MSDSTFTGNAAFQSSSAGGMALHTTTLNGVATMQASLHNVVFEGNSGNSGGGFLVRRFDV